jgi:hypothetical protein
MSNGNTKTPFVPSDTVARLAEKIGLPEIGQIRCLAFDDDVIDVVAFRLLKDSPKLKNWAHFANTCKMEMEARGRTPHWGNMFRALEDYGYDKDSQVKLLDKTSKMPDTKASFGVSEGFSMYNQVSMNKLIAPTETKAESWIKTERNIDAGKFDAQIRVFGWTREQANMWHPWAAGIARALGVTMDQFRDMVGRRYPAFGKPDHEYAQFIDDLIQRGEQVGNIPHPRIPDAITAPQNGQRAFIR